MKTSYGLEFNTVTEIDPEWSDYDKTIAGCHLANAGVVIVDTEYGQPIDNENQGTSAPYRPWKLHGSVGGADREG